MKTNEQEGNKEKHVNRRVPLFNRLLLECRDISKLITRSMDEPLTLGQKLRLRWHLLICKYCRRFQRQLFWIQNVLQRRLEMTSEEIKEVHLSNEAKERIKRALTRNIDLNK